MRADVATCARRCGASVQDGVLATLDFDYAAYAREHFDRLRALRPPTRA